MSDLKSKDEQIKKVKYELMDRYTILMASVLIVYIIIFTFFIPNKILSWYLIIGLFFASYSYLLARKKYNINTIVHTYLIVAPLFNFYIMLIFWHNSVASFCWLLPIPLAAHIFFRRKEVLKYTIYTLLNIIIGYIVANNFNFPAHSQQEVIFTDTIVYISNILVVVLLIYYKDKIRKLEVLSRFMKFEEAHKETIKVTEANVLTEDTDVENMEKLFGKIENVMKEDMLFKDVKFNLSKLSVILDVNSTYISKAIRYKGYPNFNSYLNIYRINHVKQLFNEIDFQKTTLMYIYTEAGFSNQSTFNRVFKQIEEITPSEYVQLNYKN
ncbi:helix-turn-helix domain-containing protein [Chryseobacterium scophthalmum]|uniref:Helix-turn-helix domain-containing protein n=1 Tax=Chryseobacterium scophthalmum TaxID=59733 RepID=A0A1N6HSU8_9FLAO|nr:AraC family transcriptional regulator [Chryseobacterium scophthalmum]SIO22867.1 Helix-turn-helix domain-containing protein [Chryseobacterium scophthalmum]